MKPLTINDLRNELKVAFKENNEFIFKRVKKDTALTIKSAIEANNKILVKQIDKVVNDRLSEFSDAILETIDINRNEANQKFETAHQKIDNLSNDVADLKQDVKFLHQDVKDIVTDISDKPSRKQFETFKSSFKNYPVL